MRVASSVLLDSSNHEETPSFFHSRFCTLLYQKLHDGLVLQGLSSVECRAAVGVGSIDIDAQFLRQFHCLECQRFAFAEGRDRSFSERRNPITPA